MQRFNESVSQYILDHTSKPAKLLLELERQTHLKILRPQMVSGTLQGKVLEMISCMIQPERILELGTFTGYSALCLAMGLKPSGKLITIDINDELEDFAQCFFDKSPYKDQIELIIGDALSIIPDFTEDFDLVFIDADKRQYPDYYKLVFDKVKSGGYIVADDILWYGKVNEEVPENDSYTNGLLEFNNMVQNDTRVENVIFPIRDGLMVIQKI
ncbi:MAG: O-methyltransferase [Salinivirgaceae bacterium]|jgi:caffeoyl-CoA O-methyltransferase|nr:O-methyltransferase [Salinivirgaceae bacterium]